MLKKIILAVLIALPSLAFGQKFGVVDTEAIVTNMAEFKEVNNQVEAISKKYEDELKNLQDKLQKDYADFQTLEQDAATPQSIKERRAQELRDSEQKMQQFYNTAMQDIQQQQARLMAPVQEKVKTAIDTVGAEGGYTMIFEKAQPIYVGADCTDITGAVKAKLGIK